MNDERAAEGLDHLQAAALEMIQAARAFLDVAEDLVADRDKVAEVVQAFGAVADVATRAAKARGVHQSDAPGDRTAQNGATRHADAGKTKNGGRHEDDHADGVQHIRVSL